MWASTCASSVEPRPLQIYQPTARTNKSEIRTNFTRRGSLRIAVPAAGRNAGVVSVAGAGDWGGASVGLFSICVLNFSHRLSQIYPGLVEPIECVDLVGVGARQCVLRGDNFDVGGDSGGEPAPGLRHFIIGKLKCLVGDVDVLARGIQLFHRRL